MSEQPQPPDCGPLLSADPRIFGPPTWLCLHIMAENYPQTPTVEMRAACLMFLFSLAHMLPCKRCGDHFRTFLRDHDVVQATGGRDSLVALLVDAHNNITAHTRPNQPAYPTACAKQQYMHMRPRSCPLPLLWMHSEDYSPV